jgi:hypothetical protein
LVGFGSYSYFPLVLSRWGFLAVWGWQFPAVGLLGCRLPSAGERNGEGWICVGFSFASSLLGFLSAKRDTPGWITFNAHVLAMAFMRIPFLFPFHGALRDISPVNWKFELRGLKFA